MSENKTTRQNSSSKANPLLKKQVSSSKNLSPQSLKNKVNMFRKNVKAKKPTTKSLKKEKTNTKEIKAMTLNFLYRKVNTVIHQTKSDISLKNIKDKSIDFFIDAMNSDSSELHSKDKTKDASFYNGASQDKIPIKEVRGGMIYTRDNRYIAMVEIMPINFYNKGNSEKMDIQKTYGALFHNLSAKVQIKAMNDTSNSSRLIEYITEQIGDTEDKMIQETLADNIKTIQKLSSGEGVTTRYFILYEYTGDQEGRKSNNINDIYTTMMDNRQYIYTTMQACGHACYIPRDYNMEIGEFLYYFFNRKSSQEYSLRTRINRIQYDEQQYNRLAPEGKKKKLLDVDLVAPKGLYFVNREFNYMDGQYYSYLAIKSDSHPIDGICDEWLSSFIKYGKYVDLDIILHRLPHMITKNAIKHLNGFTGQAIYGAEKNRKDEKVNKLRARKNNNTYVYSAMDSGEYLYDCLIFLTIKAETKGKVKSIQRKIIKDWSNYMSFEDSYLSAEDFFDISIPLIQINNPIFRRNKHNYLDENLYTLYMMTSYSIFNYKGYVLGKSKNSIVAIYNFDTQTYSNGNMVLLGTSGVGKTFTEQLIAQRMLMGGIKDYFIIPKKGYEYLRGCKNVNGAFISLVPGSKDCVNVLEIRPEKDLDTSVLDENTVTFRKNIIAQKTTSLILWIQLLLGSQKMTLTEYNELSTRITILYESFGITSNPDSIYENKETRKLRKMPIISDLYNEICKSPILKDSISIVLKPFIHGICENMNGQTNVDLNNNYTVFDVDEDVIGPELLPSFLFIAFDFVYSSVKERDGLAAIFLDEVWKMMRNKECAEQVSNMVKLVRGYGGCTIMATQELNDFMSAANGFGKTVINNSELKLLLKMKEEDLKLVSDSLNLTDTDNRKILKFPTGTGMLIANGDKITIEMIASNRELRAFNTDKTKEMKWAQEDKEKGRVL